MNEPRVWVLTRETKGKPTFHLRWVCPKAHKWKSRKVGVSRRVAEREAAKLEGELRDGTYRSVERVAWGAFVDEHLERIVGDRNRDVARLVLGEFGRYCSVTDLRRITYADVEGYLAWCLRAGHSKGGTGDKTGNANATVNKKRVYLVTAFGRAVLRGYMADNPAARTKPLKLKSKKHRILSLAEQRKVLPVVEETCGFRMACFVRFLLASGARKSEALSLRWPDVDFDGGSVVFRDTKSGEDRYVPIKASSGVMDDLRRLQAQTMQDGGPFVSGVSLVTLRSRWLRALGKAGVKPLTFHDLRRTCLTRLALANMAPPALMKLAGHRNMKTTMMYYVEVQNDDLRDALARVTIAG